MTIGFIIVFIVIGAPFFDKLITIYTFAIRFIIIVVVTLNSLLR